LENKRAEQVLPMAGIWYQWEGGGDREKGRRVNTVPKKRVHMYINANMILMETIPGIGERIKKSSEEGELKYNIFDIL
jgi:hypothetical protein